MNNAPQALIDMTQAKVNKGFKRLRVDVMDKVKKAAADADFDLSRFYGVVAVSNVGLDLWGAPHMAMIDGSATGLGGLAHEMGHGYGLNHSMDTRSQDYTDRWDVMSYGRCAMTSFPEHGYFTMRCGPLLNAANLEQLGWLAPYRVFNWKCSQGSGQQTVQLNALTHVDGPGYLAVRVEQYLLEFRMPESWDGGLPRPCVMMHSSEVVPDSGVPGITSILQTAGSGRQNAQPGDLFVFRMSAHRWLPASVTIWRSASTALISPTVAPPSPLCIRKPRTALTPHLSSPAG